MASKKFKGKTCAYCCREGSSAVREHVIAREFVLERYRDHLPTVPACEACNTQKSALETYALAVLPFGSVLPHSEEYLRKNMERRLTRHPTLRRELGDGSSREWIRQNGVMVPVLTMPLDHERINALVAMIVRGLFNYEFGFPLHRHWEVRGTNFLPAEEVVLLPNMINRLGQALLRSSALSAMERSNTPPGGVATSSTALFGKCPCLAASRSAAMRNFRNWPLTIGPRRLSAARTHLCR
jgi:hypothetical protein